MIVAKGDRLADDANYGLAPIAGYECLMARAPRYCVYAQMLHYLKSALGCLRCSLTGPPGCVVDPADYVRRRNCVGSAHVPVPIVRFCVRRVAGRTTLIAACERVSAGTPLVVRERRLRQVFRAGGFPGSDGVGASRIPPARARRPAVHNREGLGAYSVKLFLWR